MMQPPPPSNGWDEYRRLVLAELERLNEQIAEMRHDLERARELARTGVQEAQDRARVEAAKVREEMQDNFTKIREKHIEPLRTEVTTLNVKVVILGTVAGLVAAGIVQAIISRW